MPKIRIINLQMEKLNKIKVGITIGDPNGIGIEVILKIFEDKRIFEYFTPIVFGNTNILKEQRKESIKSRQPKIRKHEMQNFRHFGPTKAIMILIL